MESTFKDLGEVEIQPNKIIKDTAETMYVYSKETSYGTFCFNSQGDLFLNSDWGFFGYGWRAFGRNFKDFLKQTNAEYIASNFARNWNANSKSKFAGRREQAVTKMIEIFLTELRKEII